MPTVWGGEGEGGSAVDFSKARQGLQASFFYPFFFFSFSFRRFGVFHREGKPEGGSPEGGRVGLSIYMPEIETVCPASLFCACPFPCLSLFWWWRVVVGGGGCGGGCVCGIMVVCLRIG